MPIINLRVVGIQFQAAVEVQKENPSIRDVMEAARGTPRDFNFISAPDGSLFQASAKVLEPAPSISSGRLYEPGLYSLADTDVVGTNTVSTWQWYVIRAGVQINIPNGRVEKFNVDSPVLQEGDSIIWRLVGVAAQATLRAEVTSFDNKAERTTVGTVDGSRTTRDPGTTTTAQPGGRTSVR